MSWKSSERYVVLQDFVPEEEQRAIAQAIVAAVPSERPSQDFVYRLEQDLLAEARHRTTAHRQGVVRTAHVLGWVGGGALSVVTGLLIWLLVQKNQAHRAPESTLVGA